MAQRGILCLIGLLLLVAASLKLYGLNVQSVTQHGILLYPSLQFAAVQWELVLGIWLISGQYRVGAWLAAFLTFLVFASVSCYFGVIGQSSCGCFGEIQVSPWYTFITDVAVLISLAAASADLRRVWRVPYSQMAKEIRSEIVVLVGAFAMCFGLVGLSFLAFGGPEEVLARLRNERLSIRPVITDMGNGSAGETIQASVTIINRTDRPVRILGGTSDCSCVVTSDLPLTLAPGESRSMIVQLRLMESSGYFNRKAWLWTDCEEVPVLVFQLMGKSNPSS